MGVANDVQYSHTRSLSLSLSLSLAFPQAMLLYHKSPNKKHGLIFAVVACALHLLFILFICYMYIGAPVAAVSTPTPVPAAEDVLAGSNEVTKEEPDDPLANPTDQGGEMNDAGDREKPKAKVGEKKAVKDGERKVVKSGEKKLVKFGEKVVKDGEKKVVSKE